MKLGIVVYSNHSETVWNAFRLGVFALKRGDAVKVFLLANGVECESLDKGKFQVTEQIKEFLSLGGENLACGTCLTVRGADATDVCPMSTMEDLYNVIEQNDKVISL